MPPLISCLPTRDALVRWFGFSSYEDALERLRAVGGSRATDRYEEVVLTAARTAGRGDIVELLQARLRADIDTVAAARGGQFSLEYFQYLALFILESYLHRYFSDPDELRADILLTSTKAFREADIDARSVGDPTLSRIAFWAATGSGKTLLTHINIKQYRRFAQEYDVAVDASILITPNEGLSRQHLRELSRSGITARLFQRNAQPVLAMEPVVEIIDIHKLRRKSGEMTVDVSTFAGSNLILIDEAHRGATGDEWLRLRSEIAGNGFTLEYSATFGQAVAASKKPDLLIDYARSVVFEYSYGRFHSDGYGKDYDILNIGDTPTPERYQRYFLGALLVYLSQCVAFAGAGVAARRFNIAKPLMLLAGTRVNALVTEGGASTSDLLKYVQFLGWVAAGDGVDDVLADVLSGASQVTDGSNDVFYRRLRYLRERHTDPAAVYHELLRHVLNAEAPGQLVIRRNGDTGELTLAVGEAPPFGLITVGDENRFFKLCRDQAALRTEEDSIGERLFDALDSSGSSITLVLGAKKFIEGWDTRRVSAMAFANIGRSEGSEVIQLFGRGVRLLGYEGKLRRSAALEDVDVPKEIPILETLSVFGLRADYLAAFKSMLSEEDVTLLLPVPVQVRLNDCGDAPYPRQEPSETDTAISMLPIPPAFRKNRISVSYYAVARVLTSAFSATSQSHVGYVTISPERLRSINVRRLAYRLLRDVDGRLSLDKPLLVSELEQLLLDDSWYSVSVPDGVVPNVRDWENIAFALLRSYLGELGRRREIERLQGKVSFLNLGDVLSEPVSQRIEVSRQDYRKVQRVRDALESGRLPPSIEGMRVFESEMLIVSPLLGGSDTPVRPAALNKGEERFLDDLAQYVSAKRESRLRDWSVHVLRNDVGKYGAAFSTGEGRFYPDFLIWLEQARRYRLAMVDPKGLGRMGTLDDSKVRFMSALSGMQRPGNLDVLTGAIVSVTRRADLSWARGMDARQFLDRGVLFQVEDGPEKYIDQLMDRLEVP